MKPYRSNLLCLFSGAAGLHMAAYYVHVRRLPAT